MSSQFEAIAAVDVLGAEAVRLVRGDYGRVGARRPDPAALAAAFAAAGAPRIHLVDLDGARAGRIRPGLVEEVVAAAAPVPVQASGGVRSPVDAARLLAAGADRVVVGTAAFASPTALGALVDALGGRLVVALDARGGAVAARGWLDDTGIGVEAAAERCAEAGVARLLCTAVERDGTLAGPDAGLLGRVCRASGLPVIAAGGIASPAHLAEAARAGCEAAIVGRALLDGVLTPAELAWTTPAG